MWPRMHAAEAFCNSVVSGFVDEAAACLAPGASIDDPREGHVEGSEPVRRWIAGTHRWLSELSARAEPVRTTVDGGAAIVECLFHLVAEGSRRQLPVALATDADGEGRLRSVRVYHSLWALEHAHRLRAPLLPARRDLVLRPPVDAYHRALAAGDVDGVLACYERNATVREPVGEPFVHRGPRGMRRLYGAFFSNGGGIGLELGNAVDDGVACALEYTVVRWGRTPLPPQAGIAVYERGRSGLIRATRIYDDVDPPRE